MSTVKAPGGGPPPSPEAAPNGEEGTRLDRELRELVEEVRVLLPGVQVVFAFLLAVPFAQGFSRVDGAERAAYLVALLAVALASALLIAPSALHRLRWRQFDKEWLLRRSHQLVLGGTALVAVALPAGVYLVTSFVFSTLAAIVVTTLLSLAIVGLWFVVPLRREAGQDVRARRP